MEQIFISSLARGEMGRIRQAAKQAVEALDVYPVMFEHGAASPTDSRRTLLDRLAACDAVVLLLGAEYGEPGSRGVSPTEEEFNHARDNGIPVLALVQKTQREPEQEAFLWRVRGDWEKGRLSADFADATDVAVAVTRALNTWRREQQDGPGRAAAQARALELARGDERPGFSYGGSKLRVVAAPAVPRPLLDALALRDPNLIDDLAAATRSSRLIPQTAAIEPARGRDEITLTVPHHQGGFEHLTLRVGFDGSVTAEGAVGDQGAFGGSVVVADRARQVIERSFAFAEAVWGRIDSRAEVRDVFVACAVPEAEHKLYALEPLGNSMSMPQGMPHVLVAPTEALLVRRADLPGAVERLQAELHQTFEVGGAVHPRPGVARRGVW